MTSLPGLLLPWRFLMQALHIVTAVLLLSSSVDAVQVAIVPSTVEAEFRQYQAGTMTMAALAALTIVGVAIEMLCMTRGQTLMSSSCNLIFIAAHGMGFLSTLWFITSGWSYKVYPGIFVMFCLLPTLLELATCAARLQCDWVHSRKSRPRMVSCLPLLRDCCSNAVNTVQHCCAPTTDGAGRSCSALAILLSSAIGNMGACCARLSSASGSVGACCARVQLSRCCDCTCCIR